MLRPRTSDARFPVKEAMTQSRIFPLMLLAFSQGSFAQLAPSFAQQPPTASTLLQQMPPAPTPQEAAPRFEVQQVIEPAIAIVSPSKALETARVMPVTVTTSQVAPGWRVEGEELSLAADKGTAIHEAMRILLQRPDLAHRVTAHCRLSEADVTALEQQAQGLTKALAEMGYPELHVDSGIPAIR